MADTSIVGEVGGQLANKLFSGIVWFGIAFILVVVVVGVMYYFLVYARKFNIEVLLKSERAGEKYEILKDKAAIIKGWRDKIPVFRVWGLQRDFPVPSFDVLQNTGKEDLVEMYRKGEEEFYFLRPSKIERAYVIKTSSGKRIPMAQQAQELLDPEMAFWNQKRKNQNKKMFDTESLLMKILPYIPHIVSGVLIIFMLYILMDSLPAILQELQHLAQTMNEYRAADIITSNVG